jgi:stage III sporulation protein AH
VVKKQTVWLLTMLSLVVVLSVYYVTTPDSQKSNMVTSPVEQSTKDKDAASEDTSKDTSVKSSGDEQFTELRLQMEDQRSEAKADLQSIITSATASAQEKSKAYEDFQAINTLAEKEALLETLVKSQGFDDALVRADGESIRITVKANKLSKQDANKIIQLARSEVGQKQVAVKFEPSK